MPNSISVATLQETVRSAVVKATSDLCLLETLILPLIKQQRLWDHYPAILHGLWACVWSSFFLGLCRIFEFRDDDRLGSLASLLRRIQAGEQPTGELPKRQEAERERFRKLAPERLERIKAIDAELAILRSAHLAHLDMTKAGHPKLNVTLDVLKKHLKFAAETLSHYLLAFLDESQSYEPVNFGHEPGQFLKWCRLDDYATHHEAWVEAEMSALRKRHGLSQ